MKRIVRWLMGMEKLAGDTYRAAAERFSGDKEFSRFLSGLAEDEDLHFRIIDKTGQELMRKKDPPPLAIKVDQAMKNRVEGRLVDLYNRVTSAYKIEKKTILKLIVTVEFSELNNIFLYVLNTLQGKAKEINQVAEAVQLHVERIKSFLSDHANDLDLSDVLKKFPSFTDKKVLVIDNHMPTLLFVAKMLEKFGEIETASNGQEALEKVRRLFFNVIISDIDMPVMNGIQFFRKAIKKHPNIDGHIIFYSGGTNEEVESLCEEYSIIYLKKPFGINQLHKAVQTIIDK